MNTLTDTTRHLLLELCDNAESLGRMLGLPDEAMGRINRARVELGAAVIARAPSRAEIDTHEFRTRDDLACPGRVRLAFLAYEAIATVLTRYKATYTGGCRAFFTPDEWTALGNRAAPGALLVVVYDGGSLPDFFRLGVNARRHNAMSRALAAAGVYAEEVNGCHSTIYPIAPAPLPPCATEVR
jgi:hypothetical protein